MKKLLLYLILAGVLTASMLGLNACQWFEKSPVKPEVTVSQSPGIPVDSTTGINKPRVKSNSMPPYAYVLVVPWMSQVPPGDWNYTMNCAQVCCVMLGSWFNGGVTQPWVIRDENRWLGFPSNTWDNGPASGIGAGTIQRLLLGYHNLRSSIYQGHGADDVIMEVINNRPVMVNVRTHMTTNGKEHWMICIGWDTRCMMFDDPGRSYVSSDWTAGHFKCTPEQFYASWNSTSSPRIYIPVYR